MEDKLWDQAQEIMALYNSLLDITRRLEKMEAKEDAVPHMRKLYIYYGRDDHPIIIPTTGGGATHCKMTTMSVDDTKLHDEL